jgi:hypothetical protein
VYQNILKTVIQVIQINIKIAQNTLAFSLFLNHGYIYIYIKKCDYYTAKYGSSDGLCIFQDQHDPKNMTFIT